MATLTAWKFDTPEGAAEAEAILGQLSKEHALGGSLADSGISDDFIDAVKAKVTPGTSALFLLSSDAVMDKVQEAFAGVKAELIHTNLSNDEEAKLRAAFGDED